MALIATLNVAISATTEKLNKGLKTAVGSVTAFSKKMSSLGGLGVRQLAVGINKVNAEFQESFERIDKLAKTADKLGVGVDNLQGLQIASEQAGVGAQQFNTALQRMTRRSAEAAAGNENLRSVFESVGITSEELTSLSPDQMLLQIADGFGEIGNRSEQVRKAFQIFDTEGVGLVNMLKQGSGAIDEQASLLKDLGLATTRDGAAGVEMLNDQMFKLETIFNAVWDTLAAELVPVFLGFLDTMQQTSNESFNLGDAIVVVVETLEGAISVVQGFFDFWMIGIKTVQAGFWKLLESITWVLQQAAKGVNKVSEALGGGQVISDDVINFLNNYGEELGTAAGDAWTEAQQRADRLLSGQFGTTLADNIAKRKNMAIEAAQSAAQDIERSVEEPLKVLEAAGAGSNALMRGSAAAASALNNRQNQMYNLQRKQLTAEQSQLNVLNSINTELRSQVMQVVPVK